jgi:hypothetical protein
MPIVRVDLDRHSFNKLAECAVEERRPLPWQAAVLLRRALGLPFPIPAEDEQRAENASGGPKERAHA